MIPDNPSPESALPEVDPPPAAPSAEAELPPPAHPAPARWPDKPWLTIWVAPRKTMRAILDANPRRYVILLALLVGAGEGISNATDRALGDTTSLFAVLALAIVLGGLGGLLSLAVGGWLYRWTGSWFGGVATSEEVRAALAWGAVPLLISGVLLVLQIALYGKEMFTTLTPRMDANPYPLLALGFLQVLMAAWTFFLVVKTLSEAHRINAWRGLLALALPTIILFVLLFGCNALSRGFYFGP